MLNINDNNLTNKIKLLLVTHQSTYYDVSLQIKQQKYYVLL